MADKFEQKERLKLQKRLGEHVAKLRKARGLKPAQLAKKCNVERSSIFRLENGGMNPSFFFLKKLADGLEIPLDELFKGLK